MAWQGPATNAQTDKLFNKHMTIAKGWYAKGFTTKQIAQGIWNKMGMRCGVENDYSIKITRQYNGKSDKPFTVIVNLREN